MSDRWPADVTVYELVIRSGTVVACGGTFVGDIGVTGGKIVALGQGLPRGKQEIDARGLVVVPGAIDTHTHFARFSPRTGTRSVDNYESGSRAALLGGITTVLNCAFQQSGEHLDRTLERELSLAAESHVDYGFHIAITEIESATALRSSMDLLRDSGFTSVKVFTSLSPYMLAKPDILHVLEAASESGQLVNVHAEDDALCSHLTSALLAAGKGEVKYLPAARPSVAEALAVREVATYAREIGTSVYFFYLSSRLGLEEATRARHNGSELFVETRPLYLFLDDSCYQLPGGQGKKYVCLPPLRTIDDQEALWVALRAGQIQTYGTDHVAWTSSQKAARVRNFTDVPAGVSNVQTSVGMLYAEGVRRGRLSLSRFVEVIASNPAKIFGLWPQKGSLAVGADADVVLIDPDAEFTVTADKLLSNADFDLFENKTFVGWPITTVSRGDILYSEGVLHSRPGRGRLIKRSISQPL